MRENHSEGRSEPDQTAKSELKKTEQSKQIFHRPNKG